jgi:3-deoxy-D-manno-octulosonate 8-phosphate phosphatase (KDO 8-P phosphatase)
MNLTERAKKIQCVIFDVDGVLTNGTLIFGSQGEELKSFHVHDGFGIQLLQKSGIQVGIITARPSAIVTERMKQLGVTLVYQGGLDKLASYEDIKHKLKLTDAEIAYIGDDLFDLPILKRVGLSATPGNAPEVMHSHVHFITKKDGGMGAARELCELIMIAQDTYSLAIQNYLPAEYADLNL